MNLQCLYSIVISQCINVPLKIVSDGNHLYWRTSSCAVCLAPVRQTKMFPWVHNKLWHFPDKPTCFTCNYRQRYKFGQSTFKFGRETNQPALSLLYLPHCHWHHHYMSQNVYIDDRYPYIYICISSLRLKTSWLWKRSLRVFLAPLLGSLLCKPPRMTAWFMNVTMMLHCMLPPLVAGCLRQLHLPLTTETQSEVTWVLPPCQYCECWKQYWAVCPVQCVNLKYSTRGSTKRKMSSKVPFWLAFGII